MRAPMHVLKKVGALVSSWWMTGLAWGHSHALPHVHQGNDVIELSVAGFALALVVGGAMFMLNRRFGRR